jgi:hypothetical protein
VGDATEVVRRPDQVDAFARYEYLLDQAMSTLPASALCPHDSARVDGAADAGLACLHPVTGSEAIGRGRSTSPPTRSGRQLVRRALPSARCTVYDHVSAGWSELG